MNIKGNSYNEKKTIFLSYCSKDKDLADIIDDNLSNTTNITISRYTKDVEYKQSFKEFMESVRIHDYVIMIISNSYLKSRACMFEVGELLKDRDFNKKILFVIVADEDEKYYSNTQNSSNAAKIYDVIERNDYIIFWEDEYKKNKENIDKIQSDAAKIEPLQVLREIRMIIDYDLPIFLDYISDRRGYSFDYMYMNGFSDILNEINK